MHVFREGHLDQQDHVEREVQKDSLVSLEPMDNLDYPDPGVKR